jgi:undecaprenyl diphosphate synthase
VKSLANTKKSPDKTSEPQRLPLKHVAIIMDGNRRWADLRKLPRAVGHKEGVKSLKGIVRHAGALGLNYLTVYAFSSENWNRSKEEVNYLFQLFGDVLQNEFAELAENKVKLSFLGDLSAIPVKLASSIRKTMERTKDNPGLALQVAINYGSRREITDAIRKIASAVKAGTLAIDDINDEVVDQYLYTAGIPDPELLIRTGGEMRLSNYLLWQAAYTELFITDVLWPDFTTDNFDQAIAEFSNRQRRYGGD